MVSVFDLKNIRVEEFKFMEGLINAKSDDYIPLKENLKDIIGGLKVIIAG